LGRPYTCAASTAVELTLLGPSLPVTVVGSTSKATYVVVADPAQTVLCVAAMDAVRVPCAIVVEARQMPAPMSAGTPGRVGSGLLTLNDVSFRVVRWWRPPHPRGLGAAAPGRLAAAVRWLTTRVADPLDAQSRDAVAELVAALTHGERADDAVGRLLGRGPGLTPTGDDVLAGALVTLTALGSPAAHRMAQAVAAAPAGATTTVSAALLRHAARGECIPELADLLDALAGGGLGEPESGSGLARAAGALLAVGHCSGAGLLHGVLVGLAVAHSRLSYGVLTASVAAA